ncbi:MAG: NAD(P)-binding domain-containing protein [Chloroflexi bacterium]|nr:NAD(P)-binding domain-containing protein [Chloroflexota bacterium]MDA1229051.1 NAD(P)-binding domain-containing protein [Chloroflexota bacterium]
MKFGVLGSGVVGQALGTGLANLGHQVKMASRDPDREDIRDWISRSGSNASAGKNVDVAAWCDIAPL